MNRTAALWFLAAVPLAACGGPGQQPPPDASTPAGADAGPEQPAYALKIKADLGWAATANVGSDNQGDPETGTTVDDLVPATFSATNSTGGSSSSSTLELQRSGHTLTILSETAAASVAGLKSQGLGQFDITGICVEAKGARSFKVSWACEVSTFDTSGHSALMVSVSAGAGAGCSKFRMVSKDGTVNEEDWNPKSSEQTVSASNGQACWDPGVRVSIHSTGGLDGGSAALKATATMTVDPVY